MSEIGWALVFAGIGIAAIAVGMTVPTRQRQVAFLVGGAFGVVTAVLAILYLQSR